MLNVGQERVELLDAVMLVLLFKVKPLLEMGVQCSAPLAQDLGDAVDGRRVADLEIRNSRACCTSFRMSSHNFLMLSSFMKRVH